MSAQGDMSGSKSGANQRGAAAGIDAGHWKSFGQLGAGADPW